jgi:hypothetical protein
MTAPHDDQRDPRLSALLRANVDAPPLRPGFHDELEARLTGAEASGSPAAAITTVPARHRPLTTRRLIAAAMVAAAAIFAFTVIPAIRGGDTATAGDVLAAMTAASGGAQTVRLHVVTNTSAGAGKAGAEDRSTDETELTMSITGDSLAHIKSRQVLKDDAGVWHTTGSSWTTSYDQARREARFFSADERRGTTIRRPAWVSGVAPFREFASTYSDLSAILRAALAETDPSLPVRQTSYLGRPAWRGIFTVREQWGIDDEIPMAFHWDVTVDQATGILMSASCRMDAKGKPVPIAWDLHVADMTLDPELEPEWQLPKGPGRRVTIIDEGIRFGTPDEVAARSWPTLPLVPQWAPTGYRLTDIASAGFTPTGSSTYDWTADGVRTRVISRDGEIVTKRVEWPLEGQIVLVRFRRGFSSFVVRISPKRFGEYLNGTPDVTLSSGYLKGQPATFTDGSGTSALGLQTPSLMTFSQRSRVVITGDLTHDELVAVANSMKVCGDVDRPVTPGFGN